VEKIILTFKIYKIKTIRMMALNKINHKYCKISNLKTRLKIWNFKIIKMIKLNLEKHLTLIMKLL
jgi:hypothetical protein